MVRLWLTKSSARPLRTRFLGKFSPQVRRDADVESAFAPPPGASHADRSAFHGRFLARRLLLAPHRDRPPQTQSNGSGTLP